VHSRSHSHNKMNISIIEFLEWTQIEPIFRSVAYFIQFANEGRQQVLMWQYHDCRREIRRNPE
jgi:hypothetical protein